MNNTMTITDGLKERICNYYNQDIKSLEYIIAYADYFIVRFKDGTQKHLYYTKLNRNTKYNTGMQTFSFEVNGFTLVGVLLSKTIYTISDKLCVEEYIVYCQNRIVKIRMTKEGNNVINQDIFTLADYAVIKEADDMLLAL